MKHIWQSVVNEHQGASQVFVSNGGTRQGMNIAVIGLKPLCVPFNKSVSFPNVLNSTNLGEKSSQLFTGFGFRIGPEPAHPFPLDMIQISLESGSWPDQIDGSRNGTFAVGSYKSRIQPPALEITKPGIGFLKGLLLNVYVGDNLLIYPIHEIQQASVFVKVGGIIKHVLYPGIIDSFLRYLFKPVILNAMKCRSTIARKLLQPPDGITLGNPQPEPVLAAVGTVILLFPDKGATTL
jgi:hypothetical protein